MSQSTKVKLLPGDVALDQEMGLERHRLDGDGHIFLRQSHGAAGDGLVRSAGGVGHEIGMGDMQALDGAIGFPRPGDHLGELIGRQLALHRRGEDVIGVLGSSFEDRLHEAEPGGVDGRPLIPGDCVVDKAILGGFDRGRGRLRRRPALPP